MQDKTTTRKEPESLVRRIFQELGRNGAKSTNEIALSIKSNTTTVKKWVDLIEMIQGMPRVIVERTNYVTVVRLKKE